MPDSTNLIRLMQQIRTTDIYNLAAQSHVGVSFGSPEYTDAIGVLRLLEAVRIVGMEEGDAVLPGVASELYGLGSPPRSLRRSIRARPVRWPNSTATGSR